MHFLGFFLFHLLRLHFFQMVQNLMLCMLQQLCILQKLLIATKSDAIRWYLQLLLDSFRIVGDTFFDICPKIACLTSRLQSKLSLVEIGSKYRLIWITERTTKYSCAGAWNCTREKCPKVKWRRSLSGFPKQFQIMSLLFVGWQRVHNRLSTKD